MHNKNLYTLLAVFVMAATALSACGVVDTITPPAGTTSAPAVVPTTTATQVPVNQNTGTATGSSNIQWPSAMPADVPVFTYGTITGSSNDILGSIQAAYENVTTDAFDKYQSDLKNAGWTISNATQSAYGFEIDATITPHTVVAMFVMSKNNGLTGAVTYTAH